MSNDYEIMIWIKRHAIMTCKLEQTISEWLEENIKMTYVMSVSCKNEKRDLFHKGLKYKKRLLPRCMHHLKSDWINNMDHIHISGTEPSLVILGQKSSMKNWKVMPQNCQKAESRRDGVINSQNHNFNQF